MPWPSLYDYYEAIQNPTYAFEDPDLRAGHASVDPRTGTTALGVSGNFATVYQIRGGKLRWAVRCFLREFTDQERRYAAIGAHLRSCALPYTVPFEFLRNGIRVNGRWYPVLKMEWVDGVTLNTYVGRNLGRPARLRSLARQWFHAAAALRRSNVAHGDVQHGNILVRNGSLRLIDYDGMFVPGLRGMRSNERGHDNYQHPGRTDKDFGEGLDAFPAWVVFTSIVALSLDPELWEPLGAGDDHLLFRREDFLAPDRSPAFERLERSGTPEVRALAAHLRSLLEMPPADVPCLGGRFFRPPGAAPRASALAEWWRHGHDDPAIGAAVVRCLLAGGRNRLRFPPAAVGTGRRLLLIGTGGSVALVVAPLLAVAADFRVVVVACLTAQAVILAALYGAYARLEVAAARRRAAEDVIRIRRSEAVARHAVQRTDLKRAALTRPLAEFDAQCKAARAEADRQTDEVRRRYDDRVQQLADQSHALGALWQTKVAAGSHGVPARIDELCRRCAALEAAEQSDLERALRDHQARYVRRVVSTTTLAEAKLAGVGRSLKARLRKRGVVYACDIDKRIIGVRGVDGTVALVLQQWQDRVILAAQVGAPKALPATTAGVIRSRYSAEQRELRQLIDGAAVEIEQALAMDETRNAIDGIRREYEQVRDRLAGQFQAVLSSIRGDLARLDADLAAVNQEALDQQISLLEAESRRSRLSQVSFAAFLLRCLG